MESASATVVGLGRVGLPLALFLAARGVRVKGVERDARRRQAIADRRVDSNEPSLCDRLTRCLDRIDLTDLDVAIEATDLSFVVVPTPSEPGGGLSDQVVRAVVKDIAAAAATSGKPHVVVVVSTLMPGTLGGTLMNEARSAGAVCVPIVYSPVFVALGSVFEGLESPTFVLVGTDDNEAGDKVAAFYAAVGYDASTVVRTDSVNAEIAKLALNSFLAMKIAFANSIAGVCESFPGGRADAVLSTIGRDPRVGSHYLRSGPPYGGPCLPRDVDAFIKLADDRDAASVLARAVRESNRARYKSLLQRVLVQAPHAGAAIGVLGLTYKPDTDFLEDGFGLALCHDLVDRGFTVLAHDAGVNPLRREPQTGIEFVDQIDDVARRCDVCVLAFPDAGLAARVRSLVRRDAAIVEVWR
jgi:UDPglucose 6-dehydrogenase